MEFHSSTEISSRCVEDADHGSPARTVFTLSNSELVCSNPIRCADNFVLLSCV
jgi:hypothetical protein